MTGVKHDQSQMPMLYQLANMQGICKDQKNTQACFFLEDFKWDMGWFRGHES